MSSAKNPAYNIFSIVSGLLDVSGKSLAQALVIKWLRILSLEELVVQFLPGRINEFLRSLYTID